MVFARVGTNRRPALHGRVKARPGRALVRAVVVRKDSLHCRRPLQLGARFTNFDRLKAPLGFGDRNGVERTRLPQKGHFEVHDFLVAPSGAESPRIRKGADNRVGRFVAIQGGLSLRKLLQRYGDQHSLLGL